SLPGVNMRSDRRSYRPSGRHVPATIQAEPRSRARGCADRSECCGEQSRIVDTKPQALPDEGNLFFRLNLPFSSETGSHGQILAFGYRARIHSTNCSGAAIVEWRPCRTSAQSVNSLDCLISERGVSGSSRLVNSRSTTADFEFFGSSRGSDLTVASPTTP